MVAREEQLLPVDDGAIAELLRFSALAAESRDELTTQLSLVADLLRESDYWAKSLGATGIDREAVLKAMQERDYVSSVTESRIFEEIATGEMIISLDGYKTGVVNGLAVLDRGSSSFGTPTVISATVAPGTEGIVNIEHEAGLSGEIHDKGLLILEGYLRKRYARNFPLSIYSGICFEQSYAEVDGDSASSSELYALLSAIGDIPIKQNVAVTGSVNQMGELQPVGGINEKISGFYRVCRRLGLKNHPGVIIPAQNIKSLILPYEIIDAIERKEFHIYPVQTIDEGMQILTDRPAGQRNQKGNFPVDTLNRSIEDRLKDLYDISRPQN
jgi:lon-related putative ATP-dependent protease